MDDFDHPFETPEAKARWFRSLTVQQRLDWLCDAYERALALDPGILDRRVAEAKARGVLVLELNDENERSVP